MNGTPNFMGEHCVYSCVHSCCRIAERERCLLTRTLPALLCSAALNHMEGRGTVSKGGIWLFMVQPILGQVDKSREVQQLPLYLYPAS